MYGKLINGAVVPAPNPLPQDGKRIYNPTDAQYAAAGYLPIIDNPMPDDAEDTYYTYHREIVDGQIVRVWSPADPSETPEPEPPSWQEQADQRITDLETTVDALIVAALEVSADV